MPSNFISSWSNSFRAMPSREYLRGLTYAKGFKNQGNILKLIYQPEKSMNGNTSRGATMVAMVMSVNNEVIKYP